MSRIRKSALLMTLACVAVLACGGSGPSDPNAGPSDPNSGPSDPDPNPGPSPVSVAVTSNAFTPMDAAVAVGETVAWSFDQGTHNVTWVSGGFADSGNKSSGTHQVTFANAGTFDYYCSLHGAPGSGMHGSVNVQ